MRCTKAAQQLKQACRLCAQRGERSAHSNSQDRSCDLVCSDCKARSHALVLPLHPSVRTRNMTIPSVSEGILLIFLMQSQGCRGLLVAPVKIITAPITAPQEWRDIEVDGIGCKGRFYFPDLCRRTGWVYIPFSVRPAGRFVHYIALRTQHSTKPCSESTHLGSVLEEYS